jgi:hypothetical protein
MLIIKLWIRIPPKDVSDDKDTSDDKGTDDKGTDDKDSPEGGI